MRRSNTRLVCPADQTPIAREYDGTGTSSGDVCKCTQYTIGLPNGGKVCTACTGLGQRKGDNGVCTCTAGAFSNDAGTACLCPNNAQGQAQAIDQSGTCQPCLGFATITDAGSCECLNGAKRGSDNVCRCDEANGLGGDITNKVCVACGPNQVIRNGQCTCDSSTGYITTGGRPEEAPTCTRRPDGSYASSQDSCICTGNAYFDPKGFTCVQCPANIIVNGQQCDLGCPGRNAQSRGSYCEYLSGYTADIPGDRSNSLTCSGCAAGNYINFRTRQCSPCPSTGGHTVTDGICTRDTANGYGLATGASISGLYFDCINCPSGSSASMSPYTLRNTFMPGCTCTDPSQELLVSPSGTYSCGVYVTPQCDNPNQTYLPNLKKCFGPCPANSFLQIDGNATVTADTRPPILLCGVDPT